MATGSIPPAFARALKERQEALITGTMARMEGGLAFALGKLVDLLPFARREHGSLPAKEPRRCPVAVPEQRASRNRTEEA